MIVYMGQPVDVIVFRGTKFRRYPEATGWSERAYYTPGIADRQRGARRLHEELWIAANGPIPEGSHIHHADGDHLNNDVANLVCLTEDEHKDHHADDRRGRISYPGQAEHLERARVAATRWHRSPEGRAWHREMARKAWTKRKPQRLTCQQCSTEYDTLARHGAERFCSNGCKSKWRRNSGVDNETRTCECCTAEFTVNRYDRGRFCARSCAVKHAVHRSCDCAA